MTIQQWCFSFKGRLNRRDFWVWIAVWLFASTITSYAAHSDWMEKSMAAFVLVCLLWPMAAVFVKRLHDRNRSAWWAFLIILAWLLLTGDWQNVLPSFWALVVGELLPGAILLLIFIECGVLAGNKGENRYGPEPENVVFFPK